MFTRKQLNDQTLISKVILGTSEATPPYLCLFLYLGVINYNLF